MSTRILWNDTNFATSADGTITEETAAHVLEFDVIQHLTHTNAAQATTQAIEAGASISDHKITQNRRLSFEAIVTNTPLGAPPSSGYDFAPITATRGAQGLTFSEDFDRVADVYRALQTLVQLPILVTIETPLEVYPNVAIVNVDTPIEAPDYATFVVEAVEVRIVSTQAVDTPQPREVRAGRVQSAGAQQTGDSANGRRQSLLSRGSDAITDQISELADRYL